MFNLGNITNYMNILETEGDIVGSILAGALVIIVLALIIIIIQYIVLGIFLTKFHKLVYGKGTACAWIPFANTYLIGKMAVNRLVGWLFLVFYFLTAEYTTTVNGVTTKHTLIPYGGTVRLIAEIAIFVYAAIKYNQIKKGEISKEVAAYKCNQFSFGGEVPANIQQQANPQAPVNNQQQVPPAVNNQPAADPGTNTKFCTNCGSQIPNESTFCTNCGQQVQ